MRLLACALCVIGLAAPAGAQIDPRTALLERDGFAALDAGDPRRAAEAFRIALAADPKNARLHVGAGLAAYLERRDPDARAAIERALAIDPSMIRAHEILGQILRRQGDLGGAVRSYEALTAIRPDLADAAATLARWRRELALHDRMLQAVGNQFTVSFEGPEEGPLAARALDSLNRAYWRIGGVLGIYPANPIAVVLYSSEQFHDITRSPDWSAGAYDGTIRVPMRGALDVPEELDRVLAHEFTHALVRSVAQRGVPVWLNEGLATALETEHPGLAAAQFGEAGLGVSLTGLGASTRSFGGLSSQDARMAYAASAVAVGRLVEDAGGAAVVNLLRDLGEGAELEVAFERRMPRSLAAFEGSLRQ